MSFLPPKDREYLEGKGLNYEERDTSGQKAIILHDHLLPDSKFDAIKADVLIMLPPGYPDMAPDMFYLDPWVRLANSNRYPNAADQRHDFDGRNWQRWSRHNKDWRAGVDGIWVMLKRVQNALEVAQ